ncbi:hypothetical protein OQA88_3260 [Cercophora sp. LCS_1]
MGSLDERPRILFIDPFDSFANNITGLLEQRLGAQVTLVHTDNGAIDDNFLEVLAAVDAVVVGPGPGHPANPSDVGFIDKLWALDDARLLPVLGICLGFQSLCLHHGAEVSRLKQPRHGIVTEVSHRSDDMFGGLQELKATQYHSLHAVNGGIVDGAVSWEPTKKCPELQPLAWDEADKVNGPILMGVRHTTKPFWGVQFHPESICTSAAGAELIANWWTQARSWLFQRGRVTTGGSLSKWLPSANGEQASGASTSSHLAGELRSIVDGNVTLSWEKYPATRGLTPTAVLNALGYHGEEVIVLDSQGHDVGRFDMIGIVIPDRTMKVTYKVSDHTLRYGTGAVPSFSVPLDSIDQVWPILQESITQHAPQNTDLPQDIPFWGGFMGYISYEAGLETIDVEPHTTSSAPDINFAFIHRSIILDHQTSSLYVQSLLPSDTHWIQTTGNTIKSLTTQPTPPSTPPPALHPVLATTTTPTQDAYISKIRQCQTYLHSGDSYELCLTDQTTIIPSPAPTPWNWYGTLRTRNPAPHGAYIHLSDVTILSSSPERFLRWTRAGICEFRPIKGTVKKDPLNPISRAQAEAILSTDKERAENLMIVDLIRHDLAGAVGSGNVWVSQLMEVEEFAKVWHLVSVIQGRFEEKGMGVEVLKRSLPPGSMTGAPKKRSCEILGRIEGGPRGVYSGVLGYLDVGGGGDFSVVIRTAVSEREGEWRVGAGGAVTVQSDDLGEFKEMEAKSGSVLDALLGGK